MATITIGHHPELTAERALEVFSSHFADKYEVYMTKLLGRDFAMKKSGWTAVGVKLRQDKEETKFVFTAFMPSMIFQLLFGGLIAMLFLRPSWKALEEEVRVFIENAADFR